MGHRMSRSGMGLVAMACAAFACGGDGEGERDGGLGADSSVDPTGPLEIRSFAASPAEVGPFDSVELEWAVANAKVIDIRQNAETLVSTFGGEGRVRSAALVETSTFTLTARRGEERIEAQVVVPVSWPQPQIVSFQVPSASGPFATVPLAWTVQFAQTVTIERDGVEILRLPASTSFATASIGERDTRFTLRAHNPAGVDAESADVRVLPLPQIRDFHVSPTMLLATGPITIRWSTTGADFVQLSNSFGPLNNFPGTPSGTMTLNFPAQPDVLNLSAHSPVGVDVRSIAIGPPEREIEPNDSQGSAQTLFNMSAARGRLASTSDVDMYLLQFEPGLRLRAWVAGPNGTGCAVDTVLTLSTFSGELVRDSDDGAPTGRGGACPEIHADRDPAAVSPVDFQPLFISVSSERGESGDYLVVVERL